MSTRTSKSPFRFRPSVNELEGRENPASLFTAAGAAAGGTPLVDVFRPDGTVLAQFSAFDQTFLGGVRAVAAELDGNASTVEVIAAAGPGGGPHVKVFSVNTTTGAVSDLASFFAFEPSFTGGVRVAALTGVNGRDQIVVAAGEGGGPGVKVLNLTGSTVSTVRDFLAFEPSFRGGVRVGTGELDNNPSDGTELVVAPGIGGGPRVRVFGAGGMLQQDYFALPVGFTGGINVNVSGGQVAVDTQGLDLTQRNVALNQQAATAALPVAQQMGSAAVFNALFNNPAFATALAANGLSLSSFFPNGAFDPGAITGANLSAFNTAFNGMFGMLPADNQVFQQAFNAALNTFGTGTTNTFGTTSSILPFPGATGTNLFGANTFGTFPTFTPPTVPNGATFASGGTTGTTGTATGSSGSSVGEFDSGALPNPFVT